jgi:DUF971 family protein
MGDSPARVSMRRLKEVGRYALGIEWGDGHDSILPHRDLRAACPCDACAARPPVGLPGAASQLAALERLGDRTLFFRWADGHETLLIAEELRALCRCAHCVGEPNYPITKQ